MRLIDADTLDIYTATHQELVMAIEDAPTIDAVPVVRGKWIPQNDIFTKFMCSHCEAKNYEGYQNFCPNCGADMRGGKK